MVQRDLLGAVTLEVDRGPSGSFWSFRPMACTYCSCRNGGTASRSQTERPTRPGPWGRLLLGAHLRLSTTPRGRLGADVSHRSGRPNRTARSTRNWPGTSIHSAASVFARRSSAVASCASPSCQAPPFPALPTQFRSWCSDMPSIRTQFH